MDIGDLKAGSREEFITLIPDLSHKFGECWRGTVNRVAGQMGVGNMALLTFNAHDTAQ